MKALLFSIGTRGDIEPFLAQAEILKRRGWEVICVFPEQFRNTAVELGYGFEGFTTEFLEMLESEEAKVVMGGQGSLFKRFLSLVKMAKAGMKLSKDMLTLQHDIQEREKPDKILYHPKCNYALIWGMANPGKSICISPVPGVAHAIKHVTILGNYGRVLNKLSFWLSNNVKAIVLNKFSKRYRQDYPKLKINILTIKRVMLKEEKTLYTVSPSLFPRPEYWPSCAQVVGYYERNKTLNWEPDEKLEQFVNEHEKIVFISFGSMTNSDPEKKTQIIVEVLKKNNISAIINTSWGGLEQIKTDSKHIHFVSNIPYDWIFPKMYGVIHHGGSGTTHAALKYGCASMIIPHIIDQFFWNKTIAGMELGPFGTPIKKLNPSNFEECLLALLNNEMYKKNALSISQRIKEESDPEKFYQLMVS